LKAISEESTGCSLPSVIAVFHVDDRVARDDAHFHGLVDALLDAGMKPLETDWPKSLFSN
jgi:hypothetical protein